jgi:hypothetical protein
VHLLEWGYETRTTITKHQLSSFIFHPLSFPMLSPSDLLRLPYTSDLTEGGIAYALLSLPHKNGSYDQLRRTVTQTIVELAFRRYLSQQDIPFDITAATPFTDPERFDVSLGGHRCDVKSQLISNRRKISELRRDPSALLKASALIPVDPTIGDGFLDHDLLLFSLLLGLSATSLSDLKKAVGANQPNYLIHIMPPKWRNPQHWNPLGTLTLKSEAISELTIEISGQNQARGKLTRLVTLPPKTRVTLDEPFYSVTSLHAKSIPSARVGIHSSALKEAYVIPPLEWKNIWVYGMEIILAGYLTRGEFRQRAKTAKSLSLPIAELHPLPELFNRVREWEAKQKK